MRDRLLRLHHGVVNRLSRALVFLPCAVLISLCSVGPVSAASAMPNHVPTSSSAFATNTPVTAAWLKIFHRNFMDNAKEQLAFESCRRPRLNAIRYGQGCTVPLARALARDWNATAITISLSDSLGSCSSKFTALRTAAARTASLARTYANAPPSDALADAKARVAEGKTAYRTLRAYLAMRRCELY